MTSDQRFWRLLTLIEDYYRSGLRQVGDPPPLRFPRASLDDVAREVAACVRCGLCRGRTRSVPGEGAERPLVMVIGEAPGREEDRTVAAVRGPGRGVPGPLAAGDRVVAH